MTQKSFEDRAMSEAYVDRAALWTRELVHKESRGPGDLQNAMRRVSRRHGIPHATIWALRYRRPKDLLISVFTAIQQAYVAECARQARALEQEIQLTKAIAGPDCAAVRASEALVGAIDPQAVSAEPEGTENDG